MLKILRGALLIMTDYEALLAFTVWRSGMLKVQPCLGPSHPTKNCYIWQCYSRWRTLAENVVASLQTKPPLIPASWHAHTCPVPALPTLYRARSVWWTEYGRSESLLGLAYRRLQLLSWSLFLESLTLGEALLWAALWKGPLVRNWSLLPAATWLSLDTHPLVPVRFSETVVLGKSWKATHPAKPLLDSWPSETMWDSKHLLC